VRAIARSLRRVDATKLALEIEGGHFGLLYHPSPLFDRVSAAEAPVVAGSAPTPVESAPSKS
jgi:hypothetical protein